MKKQILSDLINNAKSYELDGIEFTQEDVEYVERLMDNNVPYDRAIQICLEDIKFIIYYEKYRQNNMQ